MKVQLFIVFYFAKCKYLYNPFFIDCLKRHFLPRRNRCFFAGASCSRGVPPLSTTRPFNSNISQRHDMTEIKKDDYIELRFELFSKKFNSNITLTARGRYIREDENYLYYIDDIEGNTRLSHSCIKKVVAL